MLIIEKSNIGQIIEHCKESYPEECCGILVGSKGKQVTVKMVFKGRNLKGKISRDRYELDPLDFIKSNQKAQEQGLEIVGFYHSHPDHPAIPSDFDRVGAWPCYSYLIISLGKKRETTGRSWVLNGVNAKFKEEQVCVV